MKNKIKKPIKQEQPQEEKSSLNLVSLHIDFSGQMIQQTENSRHQNRPQPSIEFCTPCLYGRVELKTNTTVSTSNEDARIRFDLTEEELNKVEEVLVKAFLKRINK